MKIRFIVLFILVLVISVSVQAQTDGALLIDEFEGVTCEDYLARMDFVIDSSARNPGAKIVFHLYEGKTPKYLYKKGREMTIEWIDPRYGLAEARIRSMRKYFANRRVDLNAVFVKGGLREKAAVAVWLVPPGAEHPKPSPTVTNMKYRKGKPEGFCTWCCGS